MARIDDFLNEWADSKDYIVAHTSGSTGTPKEIQLLKSDMRTSAHATNEFFGIGSASVIGMALSTDYIAGKMMAVRALESGARLLPLPVGLKIELDGVSEAIDLLAIVPSQMHNFIDKPHYASKVRNLLIGGAAPSAEQCRALAALGYKVFISYGMTETRSHVALARGDDSERTFHAMPGISFGVSDDDRLIIDCPRFSFKRLTTNDVVELLSPTSFRWRGRSDGAINSGGIKFFPEELEALYSPLLPGLKFYVSSLPDEKWGQAATLVVEGRQHDTAQIAEALKAAIADHRRLPKHIITVEAIPTTANGKIRRVPPTL